MFQKEKFSNILKKILENYDSIQDFASHVEMDRGYLSRNINMKLDNPPSPKILKKIANSSKGITTYSELMRICGYFTDTIEMLEEDLKTLNAIKNEWQKKYNECELNAIEQNILNDFINKRNKLYEESSKDVPNTALDIKNHEIWYKSELDKLLDIIYNPKDKYVRKNILIKAFKYSELIESSANQIQYIKERINEYNNDSEPISDIKLEPKHKKIPVLGKIPAGIPMEMIEDIGEYEYISENMLRGNKQYFALKIDTENGHSMEPEYKPGDILIVLKQDTCESGDDCIISINGFDATFKRVFKNGNGIILQPLNPSYPPTIYTNQDIIDKPVKILGVVVEFRRTKRKY